MVGRARQAQGRPRRANREGKGSAVQAEGRRRHGRREQDPAADAGRRPCAEEDFGAKIFRGSACQACGPAFRPPSRRGPSYPTEARHASCSAVTGQVGCAPPARPTEAGRKVRGPSLAARPCGDGASHRNEKPCRRHWQCGAQHRQTRGAEEGHKGQPAAERRRQLPVSAAHVAQRAGETCRRQQRAGAPHECGKFAAHLG